AISENHLNGLDILTTQYDFVGNVIQTKLTHTIDESIDPTEKTIWEFYEYDHAGRLTHHYHQYGNVSDDRVLLTAYDYNENGEQITKKMHSEDDGSNYLQEVDYEYNIRGWLTKINDADLSDNKDLFGMELVYNHPVTNIDPAIEVNYNGNITGMYWNTNGTFKKKRGYGFKYDDINRLTDAYYGDHSNWTGGLYDVQGIAYDLNGNIESISRNAGTEHGEIDNLDYVYNGNKLQAVGDAAIGNAGLGFRDGVAGSAGTEYLYDENGNMVSDANKGLTFNYNYLNLLKEVSDGSYRKHLRFSYDAAGNKLAALVSNVNMMTQHTDVNGKYYVANFIYDYSKTWDDGVTPASLPGEDGETLNSTFSVTVKYGLEYILTSEGRITLGDAGEVNYEYFFKDHLGNNRVVFADYDNNGTAEIIQEDSYYPFGLQMAGLSERASGVQPNQYLYNGKELHEELNLDWYDYGARFYDAALGRWHVVDPLPKPHESVYAAFSNNPIVFVDPDGRDTLNIIKNDAGKWFVSNTQIIKGDDVFRVNDGNETKTYTFSEGEYGERFNVLNLESKGDIKTGYTIAIYHISGQEGEGATGYAITPGGKPSTAEDSGRRLPDDTYTLSKTSGHSAFKWVQPLLNIGEEGGYVGGRGVKIHPVASKYPETRANQWTEGCYVVSTDYSLKGGSVYYNTKLSIKTSRQINTMLGATRHYNAVGYKNRPGSDFSNGINFKLIQKSGF
ncbi:MAG: RHS repeat-associated core domain-containing protein, partial [Perlabentimonas sp.]